MESTSTGVDSIRYHFPAEGQVKSTIGPQTEAQNCLDQYHIIGRTEDDNPKREGRVNVHNFGQDTNDLAVNGPRHPK